MSDKNEIDRRDFGKISALGSAASNSKVNKAKTFALLKDAF